MLCALILYVSDWTYNLTSTPNGRFFEKLFNGRFIYSQSFYQKSIPAYIHKWPLQSFSHYYDLASHTTHVVCVNFIREWLDLQFNVDSGRQIFEKLSHGRFIYFQSFSQKSAERKSYFIFDDWFGIRTQAFASNKPTHYILDHGDFTRNPLKGNRHILFWCLTRDTNLGFTSYKPTHYLLD